MYANKAVIEDNSRRIPDWIMNMRLLTPDVRYEVALYQEIFAMTESMISIVMPVYNAGIYLKDAITDICIQSYSCFELICIDDGSTDQSLEVLEYFSGIDNRVRVISQDNKGAGAARNEGLKAACGKYVIFLDADDRFDSDLLMTMYKKAEETDAQIVVCGARQFDVVDGRILNPCYVGDILKMDFNPENSVFSRKDYPDDIFTFTAMTPWNKMYDLSFIRQSNVYFQNNAHSNDGFFVVSLLAMADRIATVKKSLIWYRRGDSNSISSWKKKSDNPKCLFDMFITSKQRLEKEVIYENVKKAFAKLVAINLCGHCRIINENNYKVFQDYLDGGFVTDMHLDLLSEEDFANYSDYEDVQALIKGGSAAFFTRVIHRFVDYSSWLNDQLSQYSEKEGKDVFFRIANIPENRKIVLYGAGFRGRELYYRIIKTGKYRIVAWLDKRADSLPDVPEMKVELPERVNS